MLEIGGLDAGYGRLTVLHDVAFRIGDGEIVALVGANGAGKTTLVRALCGLIAPTAGRIIKDAFDVTRVPTHERMRTGIAVVLENRRLWGELTVRENLRLAEVNARQGGKVNFTLADVTRLFPIIAERQSSAVELLSGGEQQMVAIARALLMQPDLLIMDEPSTGLAPKIVKEILGVIRGLRDRGISLLLVEQNVGIASEIADRGYVMALGRIVHEIVPGGWQSFLSDERMVKAYLGD
ncbi:MAG: ABC transporter ATP-binding protein [Betaproteobacteria bacterium]|nr:ABC transporter ATP-binding protein [Betaproteobacteria bacterium]